MGVGGSRKTKTGRELQQDICYRHTHAKDPVAESYNRTHVTDIHMLKILWQRATTGHMLQTVFQVCVQYHVYGSAMLSVDQYCLSVLSTMNMPARAPQTSAR